MTTFTTQTIGSLKVPPLALGTMYFGTTVAADVSSHCLSVAADTGMTFWDTANNYAFWAGGSGDESETVIGAWFAGHGSSARDQITLATKVGARPLPGHADLDHVEGLSATSVRQQLIDCLRRLRTDRVDLLYAHIDDRNVPFDETLGALGDLVNEGLVREIGASNLTTDRLRSALDTPGDVAYRAVQNRFTYLRCDPHADTAPQVVLDDRTIDVAADSDITLVGYSPLLSGAYTRADRPLPEGYRTADANRQLAALRSVADDAGLDAGQAVLAWMVQRSRSVLPVVGVSSPAQIKSARTALATPLPAEAVLALDRARG